MTMPKQLVVALGNPLVGADGFGAAVLSRLSDLPSVAGRADLLDAHTDLLAHVEELAACERVILVDVVVGPGQPGHVAVYDEASFRGWPDASTSAHQMSPLMAVRLFRRLHPQAATRILLVALSVDALSRRVAPPAAAVEVGASLVANLLSGLVH
jgi:hydrogenase maturation protease